MDGGNMTTGTGLNGPSIASISAAGQERKQSQTEMSVLTLQAEVQHLNIVLGRLQDKLQPVLRSKNPSAGTEVAANKLPVTEKVGLARAIDAEMLNVQSMALEMENIVSRLEL